MRKKFFTHTDRLESLKKRSKLIKESFQKEFNKIKRLDEGTVYQELDEIVDEDKELSLKDIDMPIKDKGVFSQVGNDNTTDDTSDLNQYRDKVTQQNGSDYRNDKPVSPGYLDELDYNKIYSDTNPWDKQQVKIDDYPAEGKNLEMNIRSAEMALNGDREQRHRFLMDDNEIQEYLNKLHKIKSALDKHKNGEELDDFEKKIVKFYKSNKQSQKSRISNMAGKKLDSDYVKNFDKSKFKQFQNVGLRTVSRDRSDKNEYKVFITDIKVEKENDDVRFRVDCTVQGQEGTFVIYADGSNGFLDNKSKGINWQALYVTDTEFRKLVSSELNNIRPARNY